MKPPAERDVQRVLDQVPAPVADVLMAEIADEAERLRPDLLLDAGGRYNVERLDCIVRASERLHSRVKELEEALHRSIMGQRS